MKNTIIDNSNEDLSMTKVLSELWADPHINEVKIATGYWDLKAVAKLYDVIKPFLDREDTHLNILIGKDPYVYEGMLKNKNKYKDCQSTGDFIRVDINELELNDGFVHTAKLFLDYADGDSPKIQIRLYDKDENGNKQFLHSKCYIFKGADDSYGIIGSSNFTENGLMNNAELNYLETDSTRVMAVPQKGSNQKGHDYWFDQMWNKAEDWTKEFLVQILRKSKVGTKAAQPQQPVVADNPELTPYEVYIKYLQTQFGDIADTKVDSVVKNYLPKSYTPLNYQIDAVKQCFTTMKRYGGFILGDVVGLGKTVVGTLIIRRFVDEAQNLGRPSNVLIVTPPAIKQGWENTISDFDKDNSTKISDYVTFITTGSIAKINEDIDYAYELLDSEEFEEQLSDRQYGLILIDESHNFRNSSTQKYKELDSLIGRQHPQPFVGLLSATPQNNSPEDLKNQIYLFQRSANNTTLPNIEGGKLGAFFAEMQQRFKAAKEETDVDKAKQIVKDLSKEIRERVLNELVVRRTRSDIKQMYAEDSATLKFPKIEGPHHLAYKMDTQLVKLFYDTMTAICPLSKNEVFDPKKHIGFYRYQAIMYFSDDSMKKLYERKNLTVGNISAQLQKIMQILLVKRLESSFNAFKESLQNLLQNTENMLEMLKNDTVFICPDIDVNAEFFDKDTGVKLPFKTVAINIREKITKKKGNNREFKATDFVKEYKEALIKDKALISKLLEHWKKNDYDPKMDAFKESIKEKLFDKTINPPQKLVIFTEAKDTQAALVRILNAKGYKTLAISSENRNEKQNVIRENFDANCPENEQKNDYQVIVTTEVLAEGVNLHRANVILNYDEPWNATRLIQRIGRVNRIGSTQDKVHVFNFLPSDEGNKEIKLMEKAFAKLQAFHTMFGEDSKIFTESEELMKVDLSHITDGDASPFAEFITELKEYRKQNPERYDYLKLTAAKDFGGKISGSQNDGKLIVFTNDEAGYINFATEGQDSDIKLISPLKTMQILRCQTTDKFDKDFSIANDSEFYKNALIKYNSHVVNGIKSGDLGKRNTEALKFLSELQTSKGITIATKKLLKKVDSEVRKGNKTMTDNILRYKQQGESLFGADFDINSWAEATFAHIAETAEKKRGQAVTAFYKIG
ncbi:MAG: DEAD/DEAH box helicase family protein [Bacteroidales bacterium]|nr:DEAD/DEAH box helicase family protein [Bacteroidales bacterium]